MEQFLSPISDSPFLLPDGHSGMKPYPIYEWFDRLFLEFVDTTREKAHKFFEQYYDIQRVRTRPGKRQVTLY